jgi:hypothetical protein
VASISGGRTQFWTAQATVGTDRTIRCFSSTNRWNSVFVCLRRLKHLNDVASKAICAYNMATVHAVHLSKGMAAMVVCD